MHFLKKCFFFVPVLIGCMFSVDAHENKCVFVGQNGTESVFTLEIIGDLPADHIQIDPNGEVHIKVDKIIAVPKETFSQFSEASASAHSIDQFLAFMNQNRAMSYYGDIGYFAFAGYGQDYSSNASQREKKWQCPYCYMWWEYGERCQNKECPTNRWGKDKYLGG